jgi:hypothetical protein
VVTHRVGTSGALSAIVGIAIGVGLAGPAAAAPSAPTAAHTAVRHSVTLTPSGASTLTDRVTVLAGSPTRLVYSRRRRLAGDTDQFALRPASGRNVLMTRSGSGHVKNVGTVPARDGDFSLVGHTLTASPIDEGDETDFATGTVDQWNLDTGHHERMTLPGRATYLAAGPGGVVFTTAHGTIKLRTAAGTETLGAPFGSTTDHLNAVSGKAGVVVTNSTGTATYIRFVAPHSAVSLDNPTSDPLVCDAVADHATACTLDHADGEALFPYDAILLPLNGGAAITRTGDSTCEAFSAAVSGRRRTDLGLVWSRACGQRYETLASRVAGSPAETPAEPRISAPMVTAYGQAITENAARTELIAASDAEHPGVEHAPASPISTDAFALTNGRVVYVDDQAGHPVSVWSRRISSAHGHVHRSAARRLGSSAGSIEGNLVAASGQTTVFATPTADDQAVTLHVASPKGRATIKGALSYGHISMSGQRLLYVTAGRHWLAKLYDVATGKSRVVRRHGVQPESVALSGHYLVYGTNHGAVFRRNLHTGKTVRLRGPVKYTGIVETSVFAQGGWVGWHIQRRAEEAKTDIDGMRNAHTMGRAIIFKHKLWSLSSAGALLDSTASSLQDSGPDRPATVIRHATTFTLQRWSGRRVPLLSKRTYVAGPQLAGDVLTWAGASGVLHAATVRSD